MGKVCAVLDTDVLIMIFQVLPEKDKEKILFEMQQVFHMIFVPKRVLEEYEAPKDEILIWFKECPITVSESEINALLRTLHGEIQQGEADAILQRKKIKNHEHSYLGLIERAYVILRDKRARRAMWGENLPEYVIRWEDIERTPERLKELVP